jgi:hypothetical protein
LRRNFYRLILERRIQIPNQPCLSVAVPLEETMSSLGEAKAKEKQQAAGQLLIRRLVQQNIKYIKFQRST